MKTIIVFSFFFIISCQKEKITNLENERPDWLVSLIDSIDNKPSYNDSRIYRYEYNSQYYYHLENPNFSCIYCTVYDSNGNIICWENENLDSFISKRKNKTLIWKSN